MEDKQINHRYTKEVVCPYCGYEFSDSWEFNDQEDSVYCGECDNEFVALREIEVSYCTYKKVSD